MIILRRIGPLFRSLEKAHARLNMPACTLFSLERAHARLNMPACTLFSLERAHARLNMHVCALKEQNKGPNLLSISTWFVLRKQNIQAKKVNAINKCRLTFQALIKMKSNQVKSLAWMESSWRSRSLLSDSHVVDKQNKSLINK